MQGLISAWNAQRKMGVADLDTWTPPPFDFVWHGQKSDLGLEVIIGEDNSVIVNDTANPPWRPLVCLRIDAPGEFLIGSGLLVKPNVILTAAHNVYRLKTQSYATSIVAHVGVTPTGKAGAEAIGARVQCPPDYIRSAGPDDTKRYAYDFALIHLTSDALGRWTKPEFIPDILSQPPMSEAELRAGQLHLAGYPIYKDELIVLRKCLGRILASTTTGLLYDMDSLPGESGGPVFRLNEPSKTITFAGVHTTGLKTENRARRWDATMQQQVKMWLDGTGAGAAIA